MPDSPSETRWDRVLRRWWLPVALAVAGSLAVPLAVGTSGYTARLSLAPRGDVDVPLSGITFKSADLAAAVFGRLAAPDVEASVHGEVGHGMNASVSMPGTTTIAVSLSADTRAAVEQALTRYEALARGAMGDELRARAAAQRAIAESRATTISQAIIDIDRQLSGVAPGDTVATQSLTADRGKLVVELSDANATSASLDALASHGGDQVAIIHPATVEPRGGFAQLAALGLIGGGALGTGAALMLARRDRRVRGRRDVDPLSGARLVAGLGPMDAPRTRRDLGSVAAVAAAGVRSGEADRVVVVPWDSGASQTASARLHDEDWGSVDSRLAAPLSESPQAFALALRAVVVLVAPSGSIDERRLAEVALRLEDAGAARVQVVLVGLSDNSVDAATRA